MNGKLASCVAGMALAGAVALGASAQAADLGATYGIPDGPAPAPSGAWAGGYVGGHLGAAWTSGSVDLNTQHWKTNQGNKEVEADGAYHAHKDLGETSFLGGVHAGYNWQKGALVYGVEGDVGFASNIDYLASLRGRIGVAAGSFLFYGTAGLALGGTSVSGTISDGYRATESYNVSSDSVGFVVGGGSEYKLNSNWSLGVEGLYYGLDGASQHVTGTSFSGPDENHFYDYDLKAENAGDIGVVRGRLSYHFNGGHTPLK